MKKKAVKTGQNYAATTPISKQDVLVRVDRFFHYKTPLLYLQ